MPTLQFSVQNAAPLSLRHFLRNSAGVSAGLMKHLKTLPDGITRDGVQLRADTQVMPGDCIVLHWEEHCALDANPALAVRVVYESDGLLAVDKPDAMPVHPSVRHRTDTLANWFAAYYGDCGFHVINRLDRNTSGLCLIAKHAYAACAAAGTVSKRYYALTAPGLTGSGTVSAPIARERESVILRCVRADGQSAVTHYRVLGGNAVCTLAELIPETGRTHQIRVHMAHLGFPLLGDALYGGDCSRLSAHALHCGYLRFTEPLTGETVTLHSPLRPDMAKLAEAFSEGISL